MIIRFRGGPLDGQTKEGNSQAFYLTDTGQVATTNQRNKPGYRFHNRQAGYEALYVHSTTAEAEEYRALPPHQSV